MSRGRLVLLVLALSTAYPRHASAEWEWHLMPFIGLAFAGETNLVDLEQAAGNTRLIYGGAARGLGDGVFGVEIDFAYLPGFFQSDETPTPLVTSSSVLTLMGNGVIATPLRWTRYSLRPYASGGIGLIRTRIEDISQAVPVDTNLTGINVGGGAAGFLTDRTGLRWDLRYFRSVGEPDAPSFGPGRLSFWRASMAVVVRY